MGSSMDRTPGSLARPTTLQDVAALAASRLARDVLVAVALQPRPVGGLAEAVGAEMSAVSRCLRSLERNGLLSYQHEWRRHVYHPGPMLSAARGERSLLLTLSASTGGRLTLEIPGEDVTRIDRVGAEVWRRMAPRPTPPQVVVKPVAAPEPRGRAPKAPRPASGPG